MMYPTGSNDLKSSFNLGTHNLYFDHNIFFQFVNCMVVFSYYQSRIYTSLCVCVCVCVCVQFLLLIRS